MLRIVNTPTAAAIAYSLYNEEGPEQNILIFDLGGGTLDVLVLATRDNFVEVKTNAVTLKLVKETLTSNWLTTFTA